MARYETGRVEDSWEVVSLDWGFSHTAGRPFSHTEVGSSRTAPLPSAGRS
jgi:hypothetical protein